MVAPASPIVSEQATYAVELRGITKRFPGSSRIETSTSRCDPVRYTRLSAKTAPENRP